ncbi:glutathione S-transferase family protein [Acerihabitans sp. TG2]|uniref:glutathione S-transferase family protein n=1 Tax=Acerihabitans sp. TG2 TaxID=3096008 RepID=UPI002B23C956|nr:glutathione S-transferase family protein [Acerihabitans sp. TG2]MEA9390565.1 glutathione S-transferase family protein [Acerihabitans sp. TG2]
MYQLHIANKNYSSWSLRPWILMRVLSIPFTETLHRFQGANNHDIFQHFSPTGRVPTLNDGAIVVWDSLGIVEYLATTHAGVWPEHYQARAWARCAAAEMHSGFSALRTLCPMNCGARVRLPAIAPDLQEDLTRLDELWQQGLSTFGGPFLAGSTFSAVDAFFAPVVFRVQTYDLPLSSAAMLWCKQMLALPAMTQWYRDALAEPWRDASHEDETVAQGVIINDLRSRAE